MKRKLAGLLTALMVLAMGTTALAAGSPSSGSNSGTTPSKPSTTVPSTPPGTQDTVIGDASNTTISQVSEAVRDAVESVAKYVSADAQVTAVVDVTYDGEIPAGGVQISFSLTGVQAGDNYVLLHQLPDGRWERINPDSIENGVIKATFTSLSPVAFVKLPSQNSGNTNGTSTRPSGTTSTSNTAAGTAASPKTGAALPILPVLAAICAAGMIVCGKKVLLNAR